MPTIDYDYLLSQSILTRAEDTLIDSLLQTIETGSDDAVISETYYMLLEAKNVDLELSRLDMSAPTKDLSVLRQLMNNKIEGFQQIIRLGFKHNPN